MEAPVILRTPVSVELRTPLGTILTARGLISPRQLRHALRIQQRDGTRLGDILISEGMLGYYGLYKAVAESYGLPFINLLNEPPDATLLNAADAQAYLQLRLIPWRREADTVVVAASEVTLDTMIYIREWFGERTRIVITSPFDIKHVVEQHFSTLIEEESRLSLRNNLPDASAYRTLSTPQKHWLVALCILLLAGALFNPLGLLITSLFFCHATYAITMLFKHFVFVTGSRNATQPQNDDIGLKDLPIYTILIPMYKEAASLPGMLKSMHGMDYPASKLDIKLVLEADDTETLDKAYEPKPRYKFDIIRVPAGEPRTKPKACNYALRFARGEFITIFDADDRPEPTQLKKAVYAFRTLPPDVVCLQARLNYYNANDNLLTRFFALEYSMLFNVILGGLQRLGIPIPLGGTSNHIALERLQLLGEWDPYNVTEDADLGTRLSARGFRTAMIDSYTMEEAPNEYRAWIRQRSRWIKGYMQTWLVHMRHPVTLWNTLGWKSFIGFQCCIGLSTFTFLTAPILWVVALLWLGHVSILDHTPFPKALIWLTLANLAFNIVSHWYYTGLCVWRYHTHRGPMALAALAFPLYLVMHSIASYKALGQLIVKPHFWEKTTHGLTHAVRRQSAQIAPQIAVLVK